MRKLAFIILLLTIACDSSAQFGTTQYVFPQIADGRLPDGSYYLSTLMVTNAASFQKPSCELQLFGLNPQQLRMRDNTLRSDMPLRFQLSGNGWQIIQTSGTQTFSRGYAVLECDSQVDALVLFAFHSASGVKLSEATVFSSPRAGDGIVFLVDQRQGERLGIAVANTENVLRNYRLVVRDAGDRFVSETTFSLPAQSSTAKFLDEMIALPTGFAGRAMLLGEQPSQLIQGIGLRFTADVFTTIPAAQCRRFIVANDCAGPEVP